MAALKTLVLSTSPTSPCKEMPPGPKATFRKGHARNKSTSSAMMGSQQETSATQHLLQQEVTFSSRLTFASTPHACQKPLPLRLCVCQVDSSLFMEFKTWKEEPTLDKSSCFLERIYREDIFPCLSFSKSEVQFLHPTKPHMSGQQ